MTQTSIVAVLLACVVPATALGALCCRIAADSWNGTGMRRLRSAPLPVRVAALLALTFLIAFGGSKGGGEGRSERGGELEGGEEAGGGSPGREDSESECGQKTEWTLADVLEELAEGRKPWRNPALSGAALAETLAAARKRGDGGTPGRNAVAPLVPEWYKYDPTDTDGDGIPDLWEIWTRSDPLTPDSWLDRDGDGLSDLYEFWYQTDPRTADTDGDGFSDYFEIDNGMNPLVKADFSPEEPDTNENGIIDLWEGSGYLYGFQDSNNDGFDDTYAASHLVPASTENYDVDTVVYTSRSALLIWGEGEGEGIVLPPCTNLIVRLRLDATQDTYLRLLPAPPGQTAEGLWKARLRVSWSASNTRPMDSTRLAVGDGTVLELRQITESRIGLLGGDPPPAQGFATEAGNPETRVLGHRIHLANAGRWCTLHGGDAAVVASHTNAVPPLAWSYRTEGAVEFTATEQPGDTFSPTGLAEGVYTVRCSENPLAGPSMLLAWAETNLTVGTCQPATTNVVGAGWGSSHSHTNVVGAGWGSSHSHTNVVGAGWGSSHSHTNALDHLPRVKTNITHYASSCANTNLVFHLGFDHAEVNTRNLVRIETGDTQDDDTDHCLGLVWSQGGSTNLFTLLDESHLPFKDDLFFTVNGVTNTSGVFAFGDSPRDMEPSISHIALYSAEESGSATALDRFWLVINSTESLTLYNNWCTENLDIGWASALPAPFPQINITTNIGFFGSTNIRANVSNLAGTRWHAPTVTRSLLHHNAAYEMRSERVNSHGHQATYDTNGILITNTIAAGTADFSSPFNRLGVSGNLWHRRDDVEPFIRALQLDGNPVIPNNRNIPTNLNAPCLHEGSNIPKYLELRPITPTGVRH